MKKLKFLIDFLLIILFVLFTAYFTNRAGYEALGGDGYAHATKIKFLVDFWPNINWVYFWGNGIPVFLWYALMPYTFLVFFYKIFSSAALAIDAVNVLTFIIIGVGIYGIVWEITKSRLAALLAAFLTIPLPGLWYRIQVGTTPRTFGDGFLVLSIWFLIKALKEDKENFLQILTLVGLVAFTSLAFQSHSFTTLLTVFFDSVIILIVASGLWRKIKFFFLTFFPSFLLAFYFLGPFILTSSQNQAAKSFGLFAAEPMELLLLIYHAPERIVAIGGGLLPIHLPLLLIFLPLALLLGRFKNQTFVKKVFLAFFLLFLAFMAFGSAIFFGFPATWYSTGFVPDESFEFLSLVIPVMLGVLFWLVIPKNILRLGFYLPFFLVITLLVVWQYPLRYPLQAQVPLEGDAHFVYDQGPTWKALAGFENEKNYRYAHPVTEFALTFNFDVNIPQNREFFPHGVMYPNWRSWQENAIWNPKWDEKIEETKFLLDWYALRWFSLLPNFNLNEEKYLKDTDFELKAENLKTERSSFFEFKRASPILSLTNAPPVLIIGEESQDRSYSPLVRTLAIFNFNSQTLIPIRGKSSLDGYREEELAKFPLIVLYEYRLKKPREAGKLLRDYLTGGGKVLIESTGFVSEDGKKAFEKKLGFSSKQQEVEGGKWNFSVPENSLTAGIDFSQFSPPLYEDLPWKVSNIGKESLGQDKEPVLLNDGQVVVFRQKIGKGELIWSGFNLPYHIQSNQNREEAKFLTTMIFNLLEIKPEASPPAKGLARFVNPQKRTVEIQSGAKGVLFKENYFFNWKAAFVKDGHKSDLKVYPAGLDFMYVSLGSNESSGMVTIYYERSWMERASGAVSLLSLLALIVFVVYFSKVSRGSKDFLTKSYAWSLGRLSGWWQKENEE